MLTAASDSVAAITKRRMVRSSELVRELPANGAGRFAGGLGGVLLGVFTRVLGRVFLRVLRGVLGGVPARVLRGGLGRDASDGPRVDLEIEIEVQVEIVVMTLPLVLVALRHFELNFARAAQLDVAVEGL